MPASAKSTGRLRFAATDRGVRAFPFRIPEIWVRFLLALLGLGLAFGAALFSTVTRESGNVWATLILGSTALVLAVIVGLTTVPYLARRVAVTRLREAFEYEVTRAGIIYVVAVVVIGIAALNTGNNLLYIILATMLAAILCSGVASAFVLRGLKLDVRVPEHVFARRPSMARIVLRNARRWIPAFSINVVSVRRIAVRRKWRWVSTTFFFPGRHTRGKQWFHLPDRQLRLVALESAKSDIFQGPAYFPYLPARGELTAELRLCFDKRGLYQQESFGVATRFPFAFLVKTRRVPLQRQIVVYPSVEPTDEFFEVLPLINGEIESAAHGRGSSLYRIREYTSEDSARHVDWKATAKSGTLKVREFTREDQRKLRIVFDNPPRGAVAEEKYESAVGLAASLAWHFAGENAQVSFAFQDFASSDIHQYLSHLAVIKPGGPASVIESLPISDEYNIVVTARQRGTVPTSLWACSYFLFVGS